MTLTELAAARDMAREEWKAGKLPWHRVQAALWAWKRERDRLIKAGEIKRR
jgi:hypothetical protein